jgi:hypothetical protein
MITACPAPCAAPFSAFLTDASGFPFGSWLANDANSAWISPQSSYTSGQTDPPGVFEYELIFDLTGFDPATAVISFFVAVDNDLSDVLLNGVSQSIAASGYASLSGPFTINSDFVAGSNTLTFLTNNFSGASGNPNGLRVGIDSAEADLVPEPTTMALTGVGLLCLPFLLRRRRRRGAGNRRSSTPRPIRPRVAPDRQRCF